MTVTCSSGTYIRAMARDLGAALGVGGHLTALRRTRVGPYSSRCARTLDELAASADGHPAGRGRRRGLPAPGPDRRRGGLARHGIGARLPALGAGQSGPVAAFGPDGTLVALLTEEADQASSLAVFVP